MMEMYFFVGVFVSASVGVLLVSSVTISLPFHYHPILSQYFANYLLLGKTKMDGFDKICCGCIEK
jgi:hypothetical protein